MLQLKIKTAALLALSVITLMVVGSVQLVSAAPCTEGSQEEKNTCKQLYDQQVLRRCSELTPAQQPACKIQIENEVNSQYGFGGERSKKYTCGEGSNTVKT